MFWRWRRQRLCPHPDATWYSRHIDCGMAKIFWCTRCRYRTSTSEIGWHPWSSSRWCRHPAIALTVEWGTHEVWCTRCNTYLGQGVNVPRWVNERLAEAP